MFVEENSASIYLQGMRDRSMRSGTKFAREIQLTDWSTAGNLSNRSSGVQIPRDICTRFGRYLYSTRCSWIIMSCNWLPLWGNMVFSCPLRIVLPTVFSCKEILQLISSFPWIKLVARSKWLNIGLTFFLCGLWMSSHSINMQKGTWLISSFTLWFIDDTIV